MNEDETFKRLKRVPLKEAVEKWSEVKTFASRDELEKIFQSIGWTTDDFFTEWFKELRRGKW